MVWLQHLQHLALLAQSVSTNSLVYFPDSAKLTSCARLIPSLTTSRDWYADSHLLHLLVVEGYLGIKVTLTFLSAKCQPHHVSQLEIGMFQDAFRTLCEVLPFHPTDKAQH